MEAWETKKILSCNNLRIDMKKQWAKGKSSLVSTASYAVAMHQGMHRARSKQASWYIHPSRRSEQSQHCSGSTNPNLGTTSSISSRTPADTLWHHGSFAQAHQLTSSVVNIHHLYCNHPPSCHRSYIHHQNRQTPHKQPETPP